jgi:hypothetical protein
MKSLAVGDVWRSATWRDFHIEAGPGAEPALPGVGGDGLRDPTRRP